MTELALWRAYGGRIVATECCCGGRIVAGDVPDEIEWAVRRHNQSIEHQRWAIVAGWPA